MGNVTSTLTMRLIDGVSPIAPRVDRSLKGLDAAARKTAMMRHLAAGGALGRGGMLLAGGIGSSLMGAAAGYMSGRTAIDAYRRYADYDREITRILITAEATGAEAVKTRAVIRDIARETALPIAAVTAGLDTLVAAGRSLPEALAFLPSVSRTAQATGADVMDVARSADALGVSLKIPADRMEEAFDKMAKAGKLGKFEFKDMAQHLASLLPLAETVGFRGMDGLEKFVSYLQMIRQGTGASDEAADSMRDMMGKIASSETVNKFKKFGINVKKELAAIRKAGGNEFDAMFGAGGLYEKALRKGARHTDLFEDIQARRGVLAYRNALADRQKYLNEVKSAAGTVTADLARVTRDAAAASQRLGNAWDNTLRSLGNLGDAAGLTALLDTIATRSDTGASNIARLADAIRDLGTVEGVKKWFKENETIPGSAASDQKLLENEASKVIADAPARGAARDTVEARARLAKALKEAQRLATIAQKYPGGQLPPVLQAQLDAARKEASAGHVDAADQRLVDLSTAGLDSRAEDIAHAARRRPVAVPAAPPPKSARPSRRSTRPSVRRS